MERQPNTQYVLSLSYGKDSIATIEACKQLGYPLDRIVHAEIWFDDETPADLPPMVEFKKKADEIIKERYGIVVEHITAMTTADKKNDPLFKQPCEGGSNSHIAICSTTDCKTGSSSVRSRDFQCSQVLGARNSNTATKLTYLDIFYRQVKKINPKHRQTAGGGYCYGFPARKGAWCVNILKTTTLDRVRIPNRARELVYKQSQNPTVTGTQQSAANGVRGNSNNNHREFSSNRRKNGAVDINTVQYLGIAADEPERIERHTKKGIVLPLVDIGWDEAYCRKWCEENDLLSPIYTDAARGGCWFCHNQGIDQLRKLYHNYPELWAKLMAIDYDSPVTFKPDGHTIHDFDKRFMLEDQGLVPKEKFRWIYLENPAGEQMRWF